MTRVAALTRQVDRVRHSLSLNSLPGLAVVEDLLDSLISSAVNQGESIMAKPRQCHHCHRLTSHPEHVGIGAGINLCSLEHFELCPGGREESPSWTGCPDLESDVESGEESENTGEENGDHQDGLKNKVAEEMSVGSTLPEDLAQQIKLAKSLLDLSVPSSSDGRVDAAALANSILEAAGKAETVILDQNNDDDGSTEDEEEEILLSEIEQLKIHLEASEAKAKADRKEQKRQNRVRLENEKADLIRRSKAKQSHVAPLGLSVNKPGLDGKGLTPMSQGTKAADHLHKHAADLAAKQQQKAANRRSGNKKVTDELTIGGIRSLPGYSSEVEKILAGLQALAPSLAKPATAPSASGQAFQPRGVLSGQTSLGEEYDDNFVFNPGTGKFVRVVHSPARREDGRMQQTVGNRLTGAKEGDYSDDETSADEDCHIEPPRGYRLSWMRDKNGEKYFIQKKIKESSLPVMVTTYVCDEETGRYYKREVPRVDLERSTTVSRRSRHVEDTSASTTSYRDHRQGNISPLPLVKKGLRTPTVPAPIQHGDRLPGIIPIDSERQGKSEKIPDRIQWAKNCPVSWTSKTTVSSINVVLWAWSFISEILATRTGMAPNLETGELEARLQHFCHVLEITLQTSGQADFSGESWSVARLYDRKVQQKVDSKLFSWVQLSNMNHGASLPHELIAATQELTKKTRDPPSTGGKKFGDGKGKGTGKSNDRFNDREKCRTWNTSETRGKCKWEVEHAPEKCLRIHECTWCKTKNLKPMDHQRSFCRRRMAEEEE